MDPSTWNLPLLVVWLIMYGIILCRAGATYVLGRLARGGLAKSPRIRALLASEGYAKAEERVNRWGAPVVAISFLTVGFQTLANLAAGTTRMPWLRYAAALAVGGAAWATVYSVVGFAGFRAIMLAYRQAPVLTLSVAAVIVVTLVVLLVVTGRKRSARRERAPEETAEPLL